jgi:small subunit ribosomal protein S5
MKGVSELENAGMAVSGDSKLTDRLIAVSRVAKVVKGGRRFGFNALVAVGDGAGSVGIGMGKANDVTDAIRKAVENAKKNVTAVSVLNGTIPHEIIGRYGAGQIVLKPAGPGTGVIAGGPARAVLELVGVRNILTKCIGTTNAHNVAKATMDGLTRLRTREQIQKLRQVPIQEKAEAKQ